MRPGVILAVSWEPSKRSAWPAGPASATACARPSTTPSSPPRRASTTHTLGQVVHNAGVIAELRAQGIENVDTLDDVADGAAVVIRAHGVTPEVMARAESRGLEVIDGTCTWVLQEQKELDAAGRRGLHDRAARHARTIPRWSACSATRRTRSWSTRKRTGTEIPRRKRMALITQSTQPPWKFEKLAALHGQPRARAEDRQHRLPGHDPAPAGHHGPRRAGRPGGRRRRPEQRQHQGADAPRRDRRAGPRSRSRTPRI